MSPMGVGIAPFSGASKPKTTIVLMVFDVSMIAANSLVEPESTGSSGSAKAKAGTAATIKATTTARRAIFERRNERFMGAPCD